MLPDEPDVTTCLKDGATLVTCSGDKLLGGPQAGLIFGAQATIERLRRHPLARALRVDKLTLAALEATLRGPLPPTAQYLNADQARLKKRVQSLAAKVGAEVVASDGVVGGGGGPGVTLPGWAISLPAYYAEVLRQGIPPVVGRLEHGRCLLDLRCVPEDDEESLLRAIRAAQRPCT